MDIINGIINCSDFLIAHNLLDDESKDFFEQYAKAKGIEFTELKDYDEEFASVSTKEEKIEGIVKGVFIMIASLFLLYIGASMSDASKGMRNLKNCFLITGTPFLFVGSFVTGKNIIQQFKDHDIDTIEIQKARKAKNQNEINIQQFYINCLTQAKDDYNRYVNFLITNPSSKNIAKYKEKECISKVEKELFSQTISQYRNQNIQVIDQSNNQASLNDNLPCVGNSIGCTVKLQDDYIIINKGKMFQALNFFDTDSNTVKIPIETITVINHKPSGILDGYLEFIYQGFIPRNNDTVKHAQENVITFRGEKENYLFLTFKEMVEKRIRKIKNKPTPLQNLSIADEIQKLADLKDKGIITEDEFQLQKQKIINL